MMNTDAARWVSADVVLGVRMENISTFIWIGVGAGSGLALTGLALFFGGLRGPRKRYARPPDPRGSED
jgi:hypothetical protein